MLYLDYEYDALCFYDCVSRWSEGQRFRGEVFGSLIVLRWKIGSMHGLSDFLLVNLHGFLDDRGG